MGNSARGGDHTGTARLIGAVWGCVTLHSELRVGLRVGLGAVSWVSAMAGSGASWVGAFGARVTVTGHG